MLNIFKQASITNPPCKITLKHGLRYRVMNGFSNRLSRRSEDARQLKSLPNPKYPSKIVKAATNSRIGINKPHGLIGDYFRNLGIERHRA